MVERLLRLSYQAVALACRLQIGDTVLYTETYGSVRIGDSGKGEIGKGEIYSALTNTRSIEVTLLDYHFGAGEALTHLGQLYTVFACELITVI
jgi:hypothetical protein